MKVNAGSLFAVGYHSAVAVTSDEIKFVGTLQETFHLLVDGAAGAYVIQAYVCGDWQEIDSGALVNGDLSVVTFYDFYPLCRVIVTPVADALVYVEVYGQPASYVA